MRATRGDELERNSRGILDPGRMRRHVDLVRIDPDPSLGLTPSQYADSVSPVHRSPDADRSQAV